MSENRLNKGIFTLFSGVAFEQIEFWHQECAKEGIIGYPYEVMDVLVWWITNNPIFGTLLVSK